MRRNEIMDGSDYFRIPNMLFFLMRGLKKIMNMVEYG